VLVSTKKKKVEVFKKIARTEWFTKILIIRTKKVRLVRCRFLLRLTEHREQSKKRKKSW
jgi:hypothetical protein